MNHIAHLEKTELQIGYIPLLDCIALLWAEHQGYFHDVGLNVTLVKEASWASLRDRLAFGILDAAHCLSAMLPAAAIGDDQLGIPLQTSLLLSRNQAYISLSQNLCYQCKISAQDSLQSAATKVIAAIQNGHALQLAHVFKHSIHHYALREWFALVDENLAKNYPFNTLPPPYMVEAISKQIIDGFCVGEPWNVQAQIQGYSQVIASAQQIIPEVADKVLATSSEWAELYPNTLNALSTAIQQAQQDFDQFEHLDEVWDLLEQRQIIQFNCSDWVHVAHFHKIQKIIRSFGTQHPPQSNDFEWMIQQMCKWQNLQLDAKKINAIAMQCIGKHRFSEVE
ncbi:ABC transporter substrate-binding protein [Acinetobacter sichuanensis]|uniref:ABC transporter substrate-binding protein n=1 Tax=Acinetobacter sichuanensis TaxID=2136183 RepID=UPI002810207B|nr:ABC transporter substrate-binding protein [Acinetobacter sichuanensis]MDQ9021478.1 ABC transporter substrate-binding protein [Acinetobacter sichuanensis]